MTIKGYHAIAADLRRRIRGGEWKVGQRIPGIADLQGQYGVRSLNVIRRAQGVLVAERLLRVEQGRGAFVVNVGEATPLELTAELERASQQLRGAFDDWIGVVVRVVATTTTVTNARAEPRSSR